MATNWKGAVERNRNWRGAMVRMMFIAGTTAAALVVAGACSESLEGTPELHATAISIFSGDLQSAEVARAPIAPLTVEVRDQNGMLMAGVSVNFVTTGDATISGNPAITDTLGLASVYYTFGTVMGQYRVTASAVGVANAATFTLNARPGPAMSMLKHEGDAQTARAGTQLSAPLVVKVLDLFGNPIAGRTVTWTATGGCTLNQNTSITDDSGEATVYLTLGSSTGTHNVTAKVDNLPDVQFVAIAN